VLETFGEVGEELGDGACGATETTQLRTFSLSGSPSARVPAGGVASPASSVQFPLDNGGALPSSTKVLESTPSAGQALLSGEEPVRTSEAGMTDATVGTSLPALTLGCAPCGCEADTGSGPGAWGARSSAGLWICDAGATDAEPADCGPDATKVGSSEPRAGICAWTFQLWLAVASRSGSEFVDWDTGGRASLFSAAAAVGAVGTDPSITGGSLPETAAEIDPGIGLRAAAGRAAGPAGVPLPPDAVGAAPSSEEVPLASVTRAGSTTCGSGGSRIE